VVEGTNFYEHMYFFLSISFRVGGWNQTVALTVDAASIIMVAVAENI